MGYLLRNSVEAFLTARFEVKAEKLAPDDPKYLALQQQYQRENWLADAARRVAQLQVVTHSLKAIHPDARGTNLFRPPTELPKHPEVGSHVLSSGFNEDVVGNAAALDVYKFLKVEHGGRTLLSRVLADDDELAAAFSDDLDQGREWLRAFARIVEPRGIEASHTRAKQVYWLAGGDPTVDTDFHLLAPLYAASLAHVVYQTINDHRFSEEAKAARKARREGEYSETGFHEYPNLAVQKLGGTKPQNVSQLNLERHGTNYLLASLPPNWANRDLRPPLFVDSVFSRSSFGRRPGVRQVVTALKRFLATNPPPNVTTRQRRDKHLNKLVDELLLYAAELHTLEPGWSASPDCSLNRFEALWLDPRRADIDPDFATECENEEWVDKVSHRFGNWLNARLQHRLPFDDAAFRFWKDSLREVLLHA
ncbi:CRISPR-associated protein, Csy1 family [Thioalkalivibrio nitratireducens DSM 14787]|uniref:CRISPR-associated protein, Csy1 family n=1 Tax=Thioalkalivibrio nitratireducens (strain DSM 14787 / UNIQEM 213 / ALEN2) TaxID=1255043 RepID=L0DYK9_THIND|nr:type I-F CRISPR-associated protein Csy1 [Thioalkalivibrio nitratireducens]AGA34092.1 CRISPR-associated protein, Csy1 family [Thioalkalivibrio nitratireducens DSM 14787]